MAKRNAGWIQIALLSHLDDRGGTSPLKVSACCAAGEEVRELGTTDALGACQMGLEHDIALIIDPRILRVVECAPSRSRVTWNDYFRKPSGAGSKNTHA